MKIINWIKAFLFGKRTRKPFATAPGSRFVAIKLHLCGGTWQRVNDIAGELGIPRSTVSSVLHRHTGTFVRDAETGRWGLRRDQAK